MAFPETTLITDFTNADGGPVTNFSNLSGPASAWYTNTGTINDAASDGYNYYNVGTYAMPLDVTCVNAHNGTSFDRSGILLVQNPGASWDGYRIGIDKTAGWFFVFRADNGTETFLNLISVSWATGDSYGVRLHANGVFEGYKKPAAGSWTSQGTITTDTTYTGSFYVGYHCQTGWSVGVDGQAIDDLSAGGNVADGIVPSVNDTATIAENVKMHMPISLKMMKLP